MGAATTLTECDFRAGEICVNHNKTKMSRQMTYPLRVAAFSALLFAVACASPERFGDAVAEVDLNAQSQNFGPDGNPADPASPAFFTQTVGDRVFFAVDQSTLSSAAQATLQGQAQWLMTNADYQAIIEGHADEQGTTEYNIALSARRANAVREFLVAQGVASNRLRTLPLGKERPVELCAQERCYSQNRRSVTVISIAAVS